MTYTSSYNTQVPSGSSAYSPFNKSAPPSQVPAQYGLQSGPQSPSMPSDAFLPPSSPQDIDNISSSIDDKIARIRQAFSQPAGMAPPQSAPSGPPVSQDEIQWALQLEQKVKGGHQPTPQETARYEDIAKKLQAAQSAPQGAPPSAPSAPPVSQEDIQWALQLEQKVQGGHQPTPQETARYEDIAKRLQAAQSAPQGSQPPAQGGPQNWSSWSKPFAPPGVPNMPQPIAAPNGQPIVHVPTSLANAPRTTLPAQVMSQPATMPVPQSLPMTQQPPAYQASTPQMQPQQPQMQPQGQQPNLGNVSQQEIQWALQLEQRVNTQNYQPNPQEVAQYENIAQRLQAAQSQPTQTPQQPMQQPQMQPPGSLPAPQTAMPPQQPQYQQPQMQPPGSLPAPQTAMPPQQPQYQQPMPPQYQQPMPPQQPMQPSQQPVAPQAGIGNVSQQEIQWALQLEQRVNTQGYKPNPQEVAQYENIAQRITAAQQQPQMAGQPQQYQGMPPQQQQQIPIVPNNYPYVQGQAPQMIMPPQDQRQQPMYGQPQVPQQPQMAYGTPGTPPPPNGHYPQQPGGMPNMPNPNSSPSFGQRLKNAWSALWG